MARVACALVLHFAATAAERVEPGLRERPLAIVAGTPPVTRVVEASAAAREQGVAPGMTWAEASTRCSALAARPSTPELIEAATQALIQACLGVSPRVEDAGPGIAHVEIDGLERLVGHDGIVAQRLARLTTRVGLPARVAVADSRIAARVVARCAPGRTTIVPPGGDRAALAAAPLEALELPDDVRTTLARWGLTTVGELAALPRAGVTSRLGEAGRRAHALANGQDLEPFRPYTAPPFWEEALGLEWEIDTLPALVVALEQVLARLGTRLAAARLAADGLALRLGLASGGADERHVPLAYPMREPGPMLALLRLSLEAHPPPGSVTRIALSASAVAIRPAARTLWEPAGPAPRDLEVALARLVTLAGPQNIGSPVPIDSHRPDAFAMVPFVPPVEGGSGPPPLAPAFTALERRPLLEPGSGPPVSRLAFRRLRPPRRIEVQTDPTARGGGRRPARVSLDGGAAVRVVTGAGPWRVSGEWWDVHPWARDEWDVELADGLVCRLVRDRVLGHWYLDGVYD